jgi:hypothetical protein
MTTPGNIDELWLLLRERLGQPGYQAHYDTEAEFEVDLWKRVTTLVRELGWNVETTCLTSHTLHSGRSASAWNQFLVEEAGPDVEVLGSKNRLDIVLRHPSYGSIGIEVKCLGSRGHAAKLTQSVGQAVLSLFHRDRTVVAIHCGTVATEARDTLRRIGERMCRDTRTALVVVP